jgi:WD40 repeat protein
VRALAFSRLGNRLVSASATPHGVWFIRKGEIRVWDAVAPAPVTEVMHGRAGPYGGLALSRAGDTLVSAGDGGTIRVWGAPQWPLGDRLRVTLDPKPGKPGGAWSLSLSGDGKMLASADQFEPTIRLWELGQKGRLVATLPGHKPHTHCVVLSPDGRTLASSGCDHVRTGRTVTLWDVATRRELASFSTEAGVKALAMSADGKTLAAASGDGLVLRWDVPSRRSLAPLRGHSGAVLALAFAPGGTLASAGRDRTVRLWDRASGREIALFRSRSLVEDRDVTIRVLAFDSDGKVLAGAGADHAVRLWDVTTRRQQAVVEGYPVITAMVIGADGKTLFTGNGRTVLRSSWR